MPCYKDFASLPDKPDHVLVLVPARFAVQVIRDAAAAGARSATIVTSGFSELQDEDSQRLAIELQQAVRETGLAVTGPNCLGNLSAGEKLFTNIDDRVVTMEAGPVAIAGQSGAIVMAIRQTLEDRGVGVGYMVTTGNEAGLETPDLMAYFAADPSVRVIVVYLEGVRNTKAFRDGLQGRARRRQAGHRAQARRLRRRPRRRDGAYRRAGRLDRNLRCDLDPRRRDPGARPRRTDRNHRMFRPRRSAEGRPARGGDAVGRQARAPDRCLPFGRPELRAAQQDASDKLAKMLGPGSIVGNPLDAGFAAVVDPSVYMQSIKIMIDDPDTDIVIIDAELPKAPHELRERNSAHRQRDGGPGRQARDLYQRDVDRLHRVHQEPAQVAAATSRCCRAWTARSARSSR